MLIIGKQYTKSNPGKIGGVIILFELFKRELRKEKIDFEVIDLNRGNYLLPIFAYPIIVLQIFTKTYRHNHISLHGTANEFIYIAPFVVFYAKLLGKKTSLRKFAGNFDEIYKNSNWLKKKLVEYALKISDLVFFEPKYLVEYFKKFNQNTFWFPNVREKTLLRTSTSYKRKFIFIGHVIKTKGIDEILNAFDLLNNEYTIDIYGPLSNKYYSDEINRPNVNYKGLLIPEHILTTLQKYDILILPSYREGYPGVIIEAFSAGLPVIASNLRGIRELVTDECGILIEPKNSSHLKAAIESFNENNYLKFSNGATKRFKYFDSENRTKEYLELITKYKN